MRSYLINIITKPFRWVDRRIKASKIADELDYTVDWSAENWREQANERNEFVRKYLLDNWNTHPNSDWRNE